MSLMVYGCVSDKECVPAVVAVDSGHESAGKEDHS